MASGAKSGAIIKMDTFEKRGTVAPKLLVSPRQCAAAPTGQRSQKTCQAQTRPAQLWSRPQRVQFMYGVARKNVASCEVVLSCTAHEDELRQ